MNVRLCWCWLAALFRDPASRVNRRYLLPAPTNPSRTRGGGLRDRSQRQRFFARAMRSILNIVIDRGYAKIKDGQRACDKHCRQRRAPGPPKIETPTSFRALFTL